MTASAAMGSTLLDVATIFAAFWTFMFVLRMVIHPSAIPARPQVRWDIRSLTDIIPWAINRLGLRVAGRPLRTWVPWAGTFTLFFLAGCGLSEYAEHLEHRPQSEPAVVAGSGSQIENSLSTRSTVMAQKSNRPVKEFRVGRVKAAVWMKDVIESGRTFQRYSVRICKSFKGQDGQWQESDCYFPNDLPALRLVSERAYEFIALKESREGSDTAAASR